MSIYNFSCKTLDGSEVNWNDYRGKKILLVNTASACGFTPQYSSLQELHELFGGKKIHLIGVPSNDFGGQEPGTAADIQSFCSKNYGVEFLLFEKMKVLGDDAHPLMKHVQEVSGKSIEWNFSKILVNEAGEVVDILPSSVSPIDEQILSWIDGE